LYLQCTVSSVSLYIKAASYLFHDNIDSEYSSKIGKCHSTKGKLGFHNTTRVYYYKHSSWNFSMAQPLGYLSN